MAEQKTKQRLTETGKSGSSTKFSFSSNSVSLVKKTAVATSIASLGVAGRVALQGFPSVEPIVAIAVMMGYFLGKHYGMYAGMYGFFVSNFFVFGWHGPWTIAQMLGAGAAGYSSSIVGRITRGKYGAFLSLALGVLLFEAIVNLGTMWFWLFGPLVLIAAIPFGIIHAISTFSFGLMIYGFKDKLTNLKSKLEDLYEVKICDRRNYSSPGSGLRLMDYEFRGLFRKSAGKLHHRESELRVRGIRLPRKPGRREC